MRSPNGGHSASAIRRPTQPPSLAHLEDHELRELAALAVVWQKIESARDYGLVAGGPDVDLHRCDEIIAHANEREVFPSEGDIDRVTVELIRELAAA